MKSISLSLVISVLLIVQVKPAMAIYGLSKYLITRLDKSEIVIIISLVKIGVSSLRFTSAVMV